MVDKRSAEAENGSEAKRPRTDGQAALPNMDAIAKAKALLEKQKALQEKLKKLPQASTALHVSQCMHWFALAAGLEGSLLLRAFVPPSAAPTAALSKHCLRPLVCSQPSCLHLWRRWGPRQCQLATPLWHPRSTQQAFPPAWTQQPPPPEQPRQQR